ncbi:MAG: DUF5050 domain-containing protein [Candidatus Wallbacteria bacterium]|nr:DUF5050 domain-containing protein [Candidatus Wallbacteria bacterium]
MAVIKRRLILLCMIILGFLGAVFFITACGGGGGGGGGGTGQVVSNTVPIFSVSNPVGSGGGTSTLPDNSTLQASAGLFKSETQVLISKFSAPTTPADDFTNASGSCWQISIPANTLDTQTDKFLTLTPAGNLQAPVEAPVAGTGVNRYTLDNGSLVERYYSPTGNFKIDGETLARFAGADFKIELIRENGEAAYRPTAGLYRISGKNGPFPLAAVSGNQKTPLVLICGLSGNQDNPASAYYQQFQAFINSFYEDPGLSSGFELYSYGYDPSHTLAEIAGETAGDFSLRSEIARVFSNNQKIVLLGYSTGGLIAHDYIQKCAGTERVLCFIALGVPFHGVPALQWVSTGHPVTVSSLCTAAGLCPETAYDFFDDTESADQTVQKLLVSSNPAALRNNALFELNRSLHDLPLYQCIASATDYSGISLAPQTDLQKSAALQTGDGIVPLESALLKTFASGTYGDSVSDTKVFSGISHGSLPSNADVISHLKVQLGKMQGSGTTVHYLTSFVSDRTGFNDIFIMQSGSSSFANITNDDYYDTAPAFNKSGNRIAYHSHSEIYTMNVNGSDKRQLTDNTTADWDPAWTPDGRIVFASTRTGHWEIYIMNGDGSNPTRLTNSSNWVENRMPAVNHNGSKIAFATNRDSSNYEIYEMNIDGTGLKRLTNDPSYDSCPEYSPPDDQYIVYSSNRGTLNAINIWKMKTDGSLPEMLTPATNYFCQDPTWTPDGQYITYSSNQSGNYDIYLMEPNGTGTIRLTDGSGNNFHPTVGGASVHNLTVSILPPGAVAAGAKWSIDAGASWIASGYSAMVSENFTYEITFNTVGGYSPPANISGTMLTTDKTLTAAYQDWVLVTSSAAFSARYSHHSLVFDSKMWVIGGYGGVGRKNDVWSSTSGSTWDQATAAAAFPARDSYAGLVYDNKLWVIGGFGGGTNWYNDVWSSADGTTWTQATAAAEFTPRYGHTGLVYNGKLWVIGGCYNTGAYKNDVWSSTDGVNWVQATANAGFSARFHHVSLVYDGKMWVIGGCYNTGAYKNDVWSSTDGVNWVQATANAAFSARWGLTGLVFNNKMWVIGGDDGAYKNDVWNSADGVTWALDNSAAIFSARVFHSSLTYNSRMWVIGGNDGLFKNDVWYSVMTADKTPVDIALPTTETRLITTTYQLPSTVEVQYSDGSLIARNPVWTVSSGQGSVDGYVYTPSGYGYVAELSASYTDATVTVQRKLILNVPPMGAEWVLARTNADWNPRWGQSSQLFKGNLWVLGGCDNSGVNNDVWTSADGVNWSQAPAAAWSTRKSFSSLVFNGELWVLGGSNSTGNTLTNDVWHTADGTNWSQNADAAWPKRYGHGSLVFNGKIWVLGGITKTITNLDLYANDVWYSSDGLNWSQATAAASWSGRGGFQSLVFGGRIWVIGGTDGTSLKKDVWSSADGVNWTQATAPWSARCWHTSMVFGNKLWVMGGCVNYPSATRFLKNDVWNSADGVNWTQVTDNATWDQRWIQSGLVFQNRMWILGGDNGSSLKNPLNDIWYSIAYSLNTPVDLTLPDSRITLIPNQNYSLPQTAEVQYNDGSFAERSLSWSIAAGGGLLNGYLYTTPDLAGTVELPAGYTENNVTVGRTLEITVTPVGAKWIQATAAAGFSTRHFHSSLYYNGQQWIIGGIAGGVYKNDVWSSPDGINWTSVTGAASFSGRNWHNSVVFHDKMWVVGGFDGAAYKTDVWYSGNGKDWYPATASAFSARFGQSCLVYDNKLWVIGGNNGAELNDVWSSSDGTNWNRVTAAANFPARHAHINLVYDNKMWVIGGYGSVPLKDVWSSTDGITWVQVTGAAAFPARSSFSGLVFDNKMWTIGGYSASGVYKNDVWYSTDGLNWLPATANAEFSVRYGHRSCICGNKMWVAGGYDVTSSYHDVWYSVSTSQNTPVDISLPTSEVTIEVSSTYSLPTTAEIQYNDGTFFSRSLDWTFSSGPGGLTGLTYNPGGLSGTAELQASYTENGVTARRTLEIRVAPVGADWILATDANFPARYAHTGLFFNNRMWVIGGYNTAALNDVWSSPDGVSWTQVTPSASFTARSSHSSVVFDNKMWVIGGSGAGGANKNDVWYSSDGLNWYPATASAAFSIRYGLESLVYDNKIWVIGGYNGGELKDVWYSKDGTYWYQATSAAAFPARHAFTSLVYNNRMWVCGGYGSTLLNDVWSSADGITWIQSTAAAAFTARYNQSNVVFDKKMWVIGGCVAGGSTKNDVWYSNDGSIWTEVTDNADFSVRYAHRSCVYGNRIWVSGGNGASVVKKDVWYTAATSANTPVDLTLSDYVISLVTSEIYSLPTSAEVQYNDSSFASRSISWAIKSGGGSLSTDGYTYTCPGTNGTVELQASFTENSATAAKTLEIRVNPVGKDWILSNAHAEFSARWSQSSIVFKDKLWVIGGYNTVPLAEVWSSSDGRNWNQATAPAWSARDGHSCLVFHDKLWVMGGTNSAISDFHDVWCSDDGINWTPATSAAGWNARLFHTSLVYDNKMWVIGGVHSSTYFSDVWYSSDGANWIQATANAGFTRYLNSAAVFDGKMWVIGGSNASTSYNDVWCSTDGANWTQVTGSAGFAVRSRQTTLVFDNKLWVIGGGAGSYYRDVWNSIDGLNWTQVTANADFSARGAHTSAVFNNKMWVIAGSDGTARNDVWYSAAMKNNTPVDINLSTTEITIEASSTYALSSTGEIQYNNGNFAVQNLNWSITAGNGSVESNIFHAPVIVGTTELTASYQENGEAVSRKLKIHLIPEGTTWVLAKANAPWSKRWCQSSLQFNGKIWVLGGTDYTTANNEVWSSADGVNWTQSAVPGWSPRRSLTCLVFKNELWVMGGGPNGANQTNDVWHTTDGNNWLQNADAAWSKRYGHSSLVFDNRMWVLGGSDNTGNKKNDVWYSANGTSWIQATSAAPWSIRNTFQCLVFGGRMWAIGGSGSTLENDVWSSSDGVQWTQTAAPWSARTGHTCLVFSNKLWIMGGCDNFPSIPYSINNDIWNSADGINWVKAVENATWDSRWVQSGVVFQNRMWVTGGDNGPNLQTPLNDVWHSTAIANNTPVDINLQNTLISLVTNETYTLPTTAEIQFNDGSFSSGNIIWSKKSGNGNLSLDGYTYTSPGTYGTVELQAEHTGNGVTVSRVLTVQVINVGAEWVLAAQTAEFPGRTEFASVNFDGKMWVIGGNITATYNNDVWYTSNGINWTQAKDHADFPDRTQHAAVAFNGRMWVIGGNISSTYANDVWSSSNGADWYLTKDHADFPGRTQHAAVVFNGKMWVIGGNISNAFGNDVWSSADGIKWDLVKDHADFPGRLNHKVLVYDGKMWVIGGNISTAFSNDVWYSTDGAKWYPAKDHAAFPDRLAHTGAVFKNRMWVIGGNVSVTFANDVWYSSNGADWFLATDHAEFPGRFDNTSLVWNDKMWEIGGNVNVSYARDVWHSVASSPVTPVDISLATTEVTLEVLSYSLTPTGEVQNNDGTLAAQALTWSISTGEGSLAGSTYNRGTHGGTVELLASYTENSVKVSRKFVLHVSDWIKAADNAGFTKRFAHKGVSFKDKMWVIGGWDFTTCMNDVWSSADGTTWDQETAAGFTGRYNQVLLSFQGKLWIIGGLCASGAINDVYSSPDGRTWTQITGAAGFAARQGHAGLVFDNKLWVIGGNDSTNTLRNDVWYSSNGKDWFQASGTPFTPARWGHEACVFGGKMWVIGGCIDTAGTPGISDAWSSSDGINWVRETNTAGFGTRFNASCIVFNSKIWMVDGNINGTYKQDIWTSADGTSWTQAGTSTFSARDCQAGFIFNNRIWQIAGRDGTGGHYDVWYSTATTEITPVDIGLPTTEVTIEISSTYTLPSTGEIQYNDGTFTTSNLNWTRTSGSGTVENITFTAPDTAGTTELTTSYFLNGVTASKKLVIHIAPEGAQWVLAAASPAFAARHYQTTLFYNNQYWVIGGQVAGVSKNDVYSSTDGVTWSQVTGSAGFTARHWHTSVVFHDMMWVIGGYNGTSVKTDVFYSSNGSDWYQATAALPGRYAHSSLVYDNKMWLIGGYNGGEKRDVWYSSNGTNWYQAAATPNFTARHGHISLTFGGRMWVIGGYNGTAPVNDVWSSTDGITWNPATGTGFSTRYGHSGLVFNNNLWVIGGSHTGADYLNDVWYSADGSSWFSAITHADFPSRFGHKAISGGGKMWVLAGYDTTDRKDVWYSVSTAEVTPVDINLPTTEVTLEVNSYSLPATGEIQYNEGTFAPHDLAWSFTTGEGSLEGTTYTRGTLGGTVELSASYTENSVTVSRRLVLHFSNWAQMANPAWGGRSAFGTPVHSGEVWVIGGVSSAGNDTWHSSNLTAWTAGSNLPSKNGGFGSVSFKGRIWVLGGNNSGQLNSVWCSTGAGWTSMGQTTPFTKRDNYDFALAFNNKLWVIAGYDGSSFLSDVSSSPDGQVWTSMASGKFPGRVGHQCLVYDGKLWVMGGRNSGGNLGDIYNSEDGITWNTVTPAAPYWGARTDFTAAVFDNKMWVLTGSGGSDVWYSSNGVNWTKFDPTSVFTQRARPSSFILNNRLYIAGGDPGPMNTIWGTTFTADNTPVDISLWYTDLFLGMSQVYLLPTGEVQYNDGSFISRSFIWSVASGNAVLNDDGTFTAQSDLGPSILVARYAENEVTVSRKLTVNIMSVQLNQNPAVATGMSCAMGSGVTYSTSYGNHWAIPAGKYIDFTFTGQHDFIFTLCGVISGGVNKTYTDIIINGNTSPMYWNNHHAESDTFMDYTIPASNFTTGSNTVRIQENSGAGAAAWMSMVRLRY